MQAKQRQRHREREQGSDLNRLVPPNSNILARWLFPESCHVRLVGPWPQPLRQEEALRGTALGREDVKLAAFQVHLRAQVVAPASRPLGGRPAGRNWRPPPPAPGDRPPTAGPLPSSASPAATAGPPTKDRLNRLNEIGVAQMLLNSSRKEPNLKPSPHKHKLLMSRPTCGHGTQ